VSSIELLGSTTYPDGHSVVNQYNHQNKPISRSDQNGTVHQYLYDALGHQTDDVVATLGSGVDGAVRRLQRSYDALGLLHQVTSYSDVAGTSVANQIENIYNGFQQLITQYQEHAGVVDTSTSLSVGYSYSDGSANTTRPTGMTYPNGRVILYGYADGDDDALGRITSISDTGEANGVAYTYLGLGTFVQANYPEPNITWNLATGTGANRYAGLDSFGRVIDCLWQGPSAPIEDVRYGYDRLGNRIWRHNAVAPAGGNDELYAYDSLSRLTSMQRGTINSTRTDLLSRTFAQTWTLDATGNWSAFTNNDDVTPSNDLAQQRTSNPVNEITDITATVGPTWITPVYDAAGNMTTIPQPNAPTTSFSGTYDAWNRLVSLSGTATYSYDARNRRTTKTVGDTVRHSYFSKQWQSLEERVNDRDTPDRHFVWGLRYIDDLVLRDRSVPGTLDERLYALQDANWNVTAMVDSSNTATERYAYTAYGMPIVMDASFVPRTDSLSLYDWETRYAGYRWDSESGQYQGRRRYLTPLLGSWPTRDPLDFDRSDVNQYRYGLNQPITVTDPSGLTPICMLQLVCYYMAQLTCYDRYDLCVGAAIDSWQACNENNDPCEDCDDMYDKRLNDCEEALTKCLEERGSFVSGEGWGDGESGGQGKRTLSL
jgi:RHS repeat-associated protein